jgi:hypothetical protein
MEYGNMQKTKKERKNKDLPHKVNKYNVATCQSELKRLENEGQATSSYYSHVLNRLAVLQD